MNRMNYFTIVWMQIWSIIFLADKLNHGRISWLYLTLKPTAGMWISCSSGAEVLSIWWLSARLSLNRCSNELIWILGLSYICCWFFCWLLLSASLGFLRKFPLLKSHKPEHLKFSHALCSSRKYPYLSRGRDFF